MKNSDFLRIARLSLKSHNKQTNNIVSGLFLAAALLVPALFILFSFYAGTLAKVDSLKVISSLRLSYKEEAAGTSLSSNDFEKVTSLSGIENSAVYNVYSLNTSYRKVMGVFEYETVDLTPAVAFDGEEYILSGHDTVNLELYDFGRTSSVISEAEKTYLKLNGGEKALLAGEEPTGENGCVTVSSELLDRLNIPYDSVVGKTISFSTELYGGENAYYYDGAEITADGRVTLFGGYTVTGVFNAELYSSPSRKGEAPLFFLNESDLTANTLLPKSDGDKYIYGENPLSASEKSVSAGFIYLPYGYNGLTAPSGFKQILQFDGFKSLYDNIDTVLSLSGEGDENYLFVNCTGEAFQRFYDDCPFLLTTSIVILIFSAVILITALLNTYNTMQYSLYNRKDYLKMLCALGMREGDIKKLYLCETLLTVFRSLSVTAIFSFAECGAVYIIFNDILSDFTANLPIALTIDFIYYLPSFFIAAFAVLIFSLGISFLCLKNKNFAFN